MAARFVLGVMSLTWMVVIAMLIALEKLGPWPFAARLATSTVLAALAAGTLAAPQQVTGSGGMHAMRATRELAPIRPDHSGETGLLGSGDGLPARGLSSVV